MMGGEVRRAQTHGDVSLVADSARELFPIKDPAPVYFPYFRFRAIVCLRNIYVVNSHSQPSLADFGYFHRMPTGRDIYPGSSALRVMGGIQH